MYDDGEVLPGLNEQWTFMGANAIEWCVGLVVFLLIGACARTPAAAMPFMIVGWIATTGTLATIRRAFPDEERGVRNAVMTSCGFPPPDIPAPAILQPFWSARPVTLEELDDMCKFKRLDLDKMFVFHQRDLEDPEV